MKARKVYPWLLLVEKQGQRIRKKMKEEESFSGA